PVRRRRVRLIGLEIEIVVRVVDHELRQGNGSLPPGEARPIDRVPKVGGDRGAEPVEGESPDAKDGAPEAKEGADPSDERAVVQGDSGARGGAGLWTVIRSACPLTPSSAFVHAERSSESMADSGNGKGGKTRSASSTAVRRSSMTRYFHAQKNAE